MVSPGGRSAPASETPGPDAIIGQSPSLLAAIDLARRVSGTDIPVLVLGETGTGKELIAELIHRVSPREGPLVDVDCGAIPDDLMESLLFGHARGAFTGAVATRPGLIEQAAGGSLLLDELSNLPQRGQSRLLRVLDTGRVRRVGSSRSKAVDFRVLATAQPSLIDAVSGGGFREDLVQRVAGVVIELPPLSKRTADIPLLAQSFAGRRGFEISEAACSLLMEQPWPGNIRQLKWTMARTGFFSTDGVADVRAVRQALSTGAHVLSHEDSEDETAVLAALCRRYSGDPSAIAEALGVARATLYRRLRGAGLSLREFQAAREVG